MPKILQDVATWCLKASTSTEASFVMVRVPPMVGSINFRGLTWQPSTSANYLVTALAARALISWRYR
jgi:hypothetical protein